MMRRGIPAGECQAWRMPSSLQLKVDTILNELASFHTQMARFHNNVDYLAIRIAAIDQKLDKLIQLGHSAGFAPTTVAAPVATSPDTATVATPVPVVVVNEYGW